jgi:hypothetical protein
LEFANTVDPSAVLLLPETFLFNALYPIAVFVLPVVFEARVPFAKALFARPELLIFSASAPTAVLKEELLPGPVPIPIP